MEAFRRALGSLGMEGRIVATDITPTSPAFQKADIRELVPPAGRIEYIPWLLDIVRKHHVGLVVPMTDLDLRSLARQRGRFAHVGCTVMVGSEPSVSLCRDKARCNELFARAGLGTISTHSLESFWRQPFYPCFVKPIRGSAGVGTAAIRNEMELRAHMHIFGDLLLVQEFVPGREFTVDVYRSRDGVVRCAVPRQRLAVRSGEVEKGITVRDESLIADAVKLSSLLGDIWGVLCFQCRRPDDQPARFFEINARFGGGSPLAIAAGADLPRYLIEEVVGLPITARLGEFTEDLLMLRYDEAVFMKAEDPNALPGIGTPTFR